MPRIDLPEPYAIRMARQSIKDSLMSHGEECILIHMWHAEEAEREGWPRCYTCYDSTYKGPANFKCTHCYGTTWEGGVKDINRAWAIFTDANDEETFSKRGFWHPIASSVHTEWTPDLWQRDFVVRVEQWSLDHRVLSVDGVYVFKQVQNDSVRTGNKMGQTDFDTVSQRADLEKVSPDMPINEYQFVGQRFDRYDGKPR